MSNPLLSVVTVVKDDLEGFRRTQRSLSGCMDLDLEWIVVDSSHDDSQVQKSLGKEPVRHRYIWSQPNGVFAAMNVGLEQACGAYILFMNAGDRISSPEALRVVLAHLADGPEWLMGRVKFISSDRVAYLPKRVSYRSMSCRHFVGVFPPHQGTVIKTSSLRAVGGFSSHWRIAGDYEVALRMARRATPTELDVVIAEFFEGGLSSKHWLLALKEFHQVRISELDLSPVERLTEICLYAWDVMTKGLSAVYKRLFMVSNAP